MNQTEPTKTEGPAPRPTKGPALDSQSPIWQRLGMEITVSRFKLRANAPEGQKAISYQPRFWSSMKYSPWAMLSSRRSALGKCKTLPAMGERCFS